MDDLVGAGKLQKVENRWNEICKQGPTSEAHKVMPRPTEPLLPPEPPLVGSLEGLTKDNLPQQPRVLAWSRK